MRSPSAAVVAVPAKTKDVLAVLLRGSDRLLAPAWHPVQDAFSGWDYAGSLRHQLRRLLARGWVERRVEGGRLAYRLSAAGRLAALGGVDPGAQWHRHWDGYWRVVLFDVAGRRAATRARLLRWLRAERFGCLQDSVWVRPDPVGEAIQPSLGLAGDADRFVLLEARCCPGYTNLDLVRASWDFAGVNQRYRAYLTFCERERPRVRRGAVGDPDQLVWLRRERTAWAEASAGDPFLPQALLPAGYLGQQAWHARRTLFGTNG